MKKTIILLMMLAMTASAQASSNPISKLLKPLSEIAKGIAKNYGINTEIFNQAVDEYKNMEDQLTTARNAYDTAKSQYQMVQDINKTHAGWGAYLDTAADLSKRQWSAGTWTQTLNNISGGNSSRYKQLLDAYKKNNKVLSDEDFKKGASEEKLEEYKKQAELAKHADVQATVTYNGINDHFKQIHDLSNKIETAQNTKSSMDLNSRLVAENANVQTEMLKQLAVLNKQKAQEQAAKVQEENSAAKFNRLPDE